jgi:deoxyadenosine/deoxycytidine kinase
MNMKSSGPTIAVVGVCGSGKTTLVEGLLSYGFEARQIAQEHSQVPDMWQRITKPDLLIYLNASYPVTLKRKSFRWNPDEYSEQIRRLKHAQHHADLRLLTDNLSPQDVLKHVLSYLE